AVGVILWAINFAMNIYLAPHGDRGPYRLLIEGLGSAMAAAIAAYIRFGRSNHRTKIRLGVAAILPHAFGLALLNCWTQQPTTVLTRFFGMLAPAKPTQMLAAGLIAASMDPLGVWIAHLRGLATPSRCSIQITCVPFSQSPRRGFCTVWGVTSVKRGRLAAIN